MSYIDVTGKTVDEAIERALLKLNMDRDDVSVEILERAKSGFLGIGATPAKVRVSYEGEEEKAAPVSVGKKPLFTPEKIANRTEKKPEPKKQPEKKVAAPMDRDELRRAIAGKKEVLSGGAAPAPAAAEKKERRERREKTQHREKQEKKVAAPYVPSYEGSEAAADDAKANEIRSFLTGLLQHMEIEAEVKVFVVEKGQYKVYLEGEKMGNLIGRRGETLDAIQQLTSYSVNKGSGSRVRIHVDAENYRAKREDSLEALANKMAAKVVKYGRSMTLEPMNAYERHVIHAALQDYHKDIITYSMGTEPNRRTVVAYSKGAYRY